MNPTASNPSLSIKTVRGQIGDPLRNEILTQVCRDNFDKSRLNHSLLAA